MRFSKTQHPHTAKAPKQNRSTSAQKHQFKTISLIDFLTEYSNFRSNNTIKHNHSSSIIINNNVSKTILNYNSIKNKSLSARSSQTPYFRKETRFDSMEGSSKLNEPSQSRNFSINSTNTSVEFIKLKEKADRLKRELFVLQKEKKELIVRRMRYVDNKRHLDLIINDIDKYNAITYNCKNTMLELAEQVRGLKEEFKKI